MPLNQTSASWLTPSNSSQRCRPEPVCSPLGSANSRRYHQRVPGQGLGHVQIVEPGHRVGQMPLVTNEVSTVPGTVAGSQRLVSYMVRDRAAPSAPAQSSMVRSQPDSSGTVPSPATFSGSGCRSRTPQSVQPVTSGRRVLQVP